MSVSTIKATKVANTALGLLLRQIVLPGLVWRDAGGDFKGAKDDTISLRVPSFAPARTRTLRKGEKREKDSISERKVDVTLDTDIYKDVPITDEELTLDISDFGAQILNPVLTGMVMQVEQEIIDLMEGAEYENVVKFKPEAEGAEVYRDVALKAREYLNNARAPKMGRVLAVGSDLDTALLASDKFNEADKAGTTEALQEATIGRVAGFQVVQVDGLASDKAYAFHRTAYALASRAPAVPDGVSWGATESYQGFAVRTVKVFDPDEVEDRFIADCWTGANIVTDEGHFDADPDKGGKFTPVTDPENPAEDESEGGKEPWVADEARLVRAVEITVE